MKHNRGLKIGSYRTMFGHRFLFPLTFAVYLLLIPPERDVSIIGTICVLHVSYCLFLIIAEATRVSRTTFYTDGVQRSSWFYRKYYPWAEIEKVVWATDYLGETVYERMITEHFKKKQEGLFFISAKGKPLFSLRVPYTSKCTEIRNRLPRQVTIEKITERVTFWHSSWSDITPSWERNGLRKGLFKYGLLFLSVLWGIPSVIAFHYLNEYFFHLPQ